MAKYVHVCYVIIIMFQVSDRSSGQKNLGEVREGSQGEEQGDVVPLLGSGY